MTKVQIISLVEAITDRVYGDQSSMGTLGCAPVEMSIGYVSKSGMVKHDGVVITDSPAVIVNLVMDWVHSQREKNPNELVHAEAGFGGLIVR